MSIALDKIRKVMSALDEGTQAGLALGAVLNTVLPLVVDCIPAAQALRVYRFTGQTAILEAATDAAAPAQKPLADTDHAALEAGEPLHDQSRWIVPLLRDVWVFGWLEVDAPDEPDMPSLLSLLAYPLARAIQQIESSDLTADSLVLSSRLITTADHYDDMVQAVVYTVARHMAGASITLFDQPLDSTTIPQARTVAALGTPEGALTLQDTSYHPDLPTEEQLKNLARGLPVIVQDFQRSGFALSPRQVPNQQITWLAAFGLRAGDRVLGTLEILHTHPYQLLPEEIDAYTTLADQIGVAVRNRQLLRQTSSALDEVKTLYEINRAMIAAQDHLDVLRALYSLSPDAVTLAHVAVSYNPDGKIDDLIIKHVLTPENEQVHHLSMRDRLGDDALSLIRAYWQNEPKTPVFVEDALSSSKDTPLELLYRAEQDGIRSAVDIPVYERDRLSDLIRVAFTRPRTFDEGTRRLYHALADQIAIVFQNQRLLQETQVNAAELSNQVRVLQTLNALSTALAAAHDEQTLLDEAAQAMVTAFNVDACHVMMLSPSQETLTISSEYPPQDRVGTEFDVSALSDFFKEEPVLIDDIETESPLSDLYHRWCQSTGVQSMLGIPLLMQGQLIGVVALESRQFKRAFNEAAIETAQTITAQLMAALQNLRLLRNAQRQAEQLQRASSFSQQLQMSLDLHTTLELALTQSRQIIPFDHMLIALRDGETLRTAAIYTGGEVYLTLQDGLTAALDETILGRVWDNQEFLHIQNTQRVSYRDLQSGTLSRMRSVMAMPVLARGDKVGVALIGSEKPYAYSDGDAVVFSHIVSQLAVAIGNISLYDRSQRIARSEALVNDIATRLQQQIDIQSMMNVTVNELGRALGARRARMRLGTLNPSGNDVEQG